MRDILIKDKLSFKIQDSTLESSKWANKIIGVSIKDIKNQNGLPIEEVLAFFLS